MDPKRAGDRIRGSGHYWMIGDSYARDIEGASRSGWHSVWINRRNEPVTDVTPDLMFENEYDMTNYLLCSAE